MPDALPLTGLYGKVPAHGDFVRRGLPSSFVGPWDAWLQSGIARARESMGASWESAWDSAPAWRFALPAGACGPDAVAGVMLPSEDQVGRRFPVTLAALLPAGAAPPSAAWFDVLEAAAWAGRRGQADADALAATLPLPGAPLPEAAPPAPGPATPTAAASDAEPTPAPPAETTEVLAEVALPPAEPPVEAGDVLALLGGAAPMGGPEPDPPPGDVLAMFGTEPAVPAPALPATRAGGTTGGDGTLAMLIGAASPGQPSGSEAPPDGDPLAALIGAGSGHDGAQSPAEDVLTTIAQPWPDPEPATPAQMAPAVPAPPAPEGGGWWTRGAAHVPPMVWPLAALPRPEDFVYLLEAEA